MAFTKICILSVVSLMSLSFATAQGNYILKTYTTRDGLPHNQVYDIAQDSTGFIWIATWDGLSRFDGYDFNNYYHDPDDTTSIPYFSAYRIVVDQSNNIWIDFTKSSA